MDKIEQKIKWAYNFCKNNYLHIDKKSKILGEILTYEIPRAETACELGKLFYQKKQYFDAIYWFEYALKKPLSDNEFIILRCYDLIPIKYLYKCNKKLFNISQMLYYKKMLQILKK